MTTVPRQRLAPRGHISQMPQFVLDRLAEVGPVFGRDIVGNTAKTLEVYDPILAIAPKDSVKVTTNVAYGSHERHRLDVYQPEAKTGTPIVIYVHGGAYVRGDRAISPEVYANVGFYFARQGILSVVAAYRLASESKWPGGALDVAAAVKWAKENGSAFGGTPERIYLVGHSAGATHASTYCFMPELQPASGHGISGIVLMSGRYLFDPRPDDPNLPNFHAHFGTDAGRYPAQSPINFIENARELPIFIVVSEFDNPGLDVQSALLLSAICKRDGRCPRFLWMERHNHLSMAFQFNTQDDLLGREILTFIERAR